MADDSHALTDFLRTGLDLGALVAKKKILGTDATTQIELEKERARNNQLNGSGVVNQRAADSGPFGWLDFLYGSPTQRLATGDTITAQRNMWPPIIMGLVLAFLVFWFFFKKKG